ncbi:hypothetical protein [Pseudomonas japonica]|uniref:Type III secretion protein YscO n=1 Tax=Pseudomonas japonica TaxID=256466 RepID=A0A239BK06_9PSED|nr:hypothetical protein [Pseudomonas japonica]SNS08186.1 hypothetical protein SAMN05444352_10311 [Pseudomonas japonica]
MQPDPRTLHQLQAARRLRVMQREKADRLHERSREALRQAQERFDLEQADYHEILERLGQHARAGARFDPAQHEQRLLAQQAAHARIEARRRDLVEAQTVQQQALAELLKCKVNQDVADKACQRIAEALRQVREHRESIDVFDSQQARRAAHGL